MTVASFSAAYPADDRRPAAPGGVLGPLVLAYLVGGGLGAGIVFAGHGLLAGFVAAWLSAIVLTVTVPALALLRRPAGSREAAQADLEAWEADLGAELEAVRASRRVA